MISQFTLNLPHSIPNPATDVGVRQITQILVLYNRNRAEKKKAFEYPRNWWARVLVTKWNPTAEYLSHNPSVDNQFELK